MRQLLIFLTGSIVVSSASFAQKRSGHEGSGGGGGIACFDTRNIRENAFDKGLLKREAIKDIQEFFLLDFYEPQPDGWAKRLNMLEFTSLHNLASVYGIGTSDESLNEEGYKQRGPEDFKTVLKHSKRYIDGIDLAIGSSYSPLLMQALLMARKKLPFENWIDANGPIAELQDQGVLKFEIPEECGYVQVAIRSPSENGWKVVYDRELVETKFSGFMLAMLRFHEEIYLVGEFLYDFQKDWRFFNSESVRSLTQTVFSGAFHNWSNDRDHCEKYRRFHKLIQDLKFTDGLEQLVNNQKSKTLPLTIVDYDQTCGRQLKIQN